MPYPKQKHLRRHGANIYLNVLVNLIDFEKYIKMIENIFVEQTICIRMVKEQMNRAQMKRLFSICLYQTSTEV